MDRQISLASIEVRSFLTKNITLRSEKMKSLLMKEQGKLFEENINDWKG